MLSDLVDIRFINLVIQFYSHGTNKLIFARMLLASSSVQRPHCSAIGKLSLSNNCRA